MQTSCPSAIVSPTSQETDFTVPGIGDNTTLDTSTWNYFNRISERGYCYPPSQIVLYNTVVEEIRLKWECLLMGRFIVSWERFYH
jgi:hypothetical protein